MPKFTDEYDKKSEIKIISVSELGCWFGIWRDDLYKLKGRKIVVLNTKNHRIVGAFTLIDIPVPIKKMCPTCSGKGNIEIKYN